MYLTFKRTFARRQNAEYARRSRLEKQTTDPVPAGRRHYYM
jgi:hypothetical protein